MFSALTNGNRRSRGAALAALAIAAVPLAGAVSAQAASAGDITATSTITATSIASPADSTRYYQAPADKTGGFTVSGTVTGASSGDAVDIDCYADDGTDNGRLVSGVTVTDGRFSAKVTYAEMSSDLYVNQCRLRAVPAGTKPTTGLSSYAGPRVMLTSLSLTKNKAGKISDYGLTSGQLTSDNSYSSLGGGGIDSGVLEPSGIFADEYAGPFTFLENDTLANGGGVTVGGKTAYAPGDVPQDTHLSGFEGLKVTATANLKNGNVTIHETDPLMLCKTSACESYRSSGVEDRRTITQTDGGHVILVKDSFSSTDGSAHTLKLRLQNEQHFALNSFTPDTTNEYRFPGHSSYETFDSPRTVRLAPTAPGTVFVNGDKKDGSTISARGAITYGTTPSGALDFAVDANAFFAPYTLTVPRRGAVSLYFGYSQDLDQANVNADARAVARTIARDEHEAR